MATIEIVFRATWITDVATGTSVQVWKTDRTETDSRDVQVRSYAGGRTRIVSTPRRERSTPLTFRGVSDADTETLRGWAGRVLLLRDAQGWRRFGTFAGFQSTAIYPAPAPIVNDVSLVWMDSDFNEAV